MLRCVAPATRVTSRFGRRRARTATLTVGKSFDVFGPRKCRAAEKDPGRQTIATRHAMLPPHTRKSALKGPATVPRVP